VSRAGLALGLLLLVAACKPEGGVKLVYANGAGAKAAAEKRLRALMVRSAHVEIEGADLAVYVPSGRRLDDVKEVLGRRGQLELSFVVETGAMPSADEALDGGVTLAREPVGDGVSAMLEGPTREAVAAEAARFWPGQRVLVAPEKSGFRSWVLDPQPVVTGADIADATDSLDPQMSTPVVDVVLTDAGKKAFANATAEGVKRRLAIIVDGEVKSAPTVMEPITGGRARITLGAGAQLSEARTTAAALKGGVLPEGFVLKSEAPYAPRAW
jgi:preprotein translocase subunit SecD